MNFLDELNKEQRQAVVSTSPVISVIAGPGTGKTKTLIARIIYLIQHQKVEPSQIVALTFTKKAAAEMRERLMTAVGAATAQKVWIGTFHAFCTMLLHKAHISLKLVEEERRLSYVKEAIDQAAWKGTARDASATITRLKNTLSADEYALVAAYDQILKREQVVDYDDILLQALQQLRTNDSFRASLQQGISQILIDEFQDTSPVQYEAVKLLCKASDKNLYVIGDPFQSIYAFRGSSSEIFQQLQSDFPALEQITLVLNYRSAQDIITVSSRLFDQIKLQPTISDSGKVHLTRCLNEYAEADYVVSEITKLVGGTDLIQAGALQSAVSGFRFSDCAVIFRAHRLKLPLVTALIRSGIPFQAIGEESIFAKPAVRCIIDCLRVVYIKDEQSVSKLTKYPFIKPLDIHKYLIAMGVHKSKLSDMIQNIEHVFALSEMYENDKEYDISMKQFRQTLIQFNSQKNGLSNALSYIQYLDEHEFYDPRADRVTLLTMHAAKGLEFAHVILCGFEEGIIPHTFHHQLQAKEEEKRLLYVALTRAKVSLTLLYTRSRDKKNAVLSFFYDRLKCNELGEYEDENTVKIMKRIEKKKLEKSQMKMF